MTTAYHPSPELDQRLRSALAPLLGVGILCAIASIIGGISDPHDFFRSYLMGWLFWLGVALGALGIVMMQYLTAGAWGVMTRRTFECAMKTLPLLGLLFIPIACALPQIYDWAHPDLVNKEYVLRHRALYMNQTAFIIRGVAYFVIWILLAFLLSKWSRQQDDAPLAQVDAIEKRMTRLSAPGLILFVFTVTFSAIDWAESLENDWYSTIWGFLFVAMFALSGFAFVIIVMTILSRWEPLASRMKASHFHDLGKLTLCFVMVWAYFEFAQLLIVWAGNLTDEIPWFLRRLATSWGVLGALLIIFEFIIPFLLLLSRPLKRNAYTLSGIVSIIIIMRWIEMMWIVMPSYYQEGFRFTWMNIVVPLAIACLWLAVFVWQLRTVPLLPLQAPNLERALHHGE